MPDYRSFFDRELIGAWDIQDENGKSRDAVVTIARVEAGVLTNGNKKSRKPILFFEGKERGMAINKTNGKVLASLFGPRTEKWIGRKIILFATTTQFGSETMECIRIRPKIPADKQNGAAPNAPHIDDGSVPDDEVPA